MSANFNRRLESVFLDQWRLAEEARAAGSAQERKYKDAARSLKHFLREPRTATPAVHVIGPVRHAAAYNRAFRVLADDDREDVRKLKQAMDVTGFVTVVDNQHLIHSSRQHGSQGSEAKRGQIAIVAEDYAKLPQILGEPDEVKPGYSGRRGAPAALVTKLLNGLLYTVVVEARCRRRQVSFVTMHKKAG
jgi:hypothetical protein